MAEQENLQIVQEAYAAMGRGDMQALLNAMSDDMDWQIFGPEDIIPVAGRRHGREQVAQLFSSIGDVVEIQEFEPREFIAQGDNVVALGYERTKVKSTGRVFENNWSHVWTVRGSKVVRFREYWDTAAGAAAFRES